MKTFNVIFDADGGILAINGIEAESQGEAVSKARKETADHHNVRFKYCMETEKEKK